MSTCTDARDDCTTTEPETFRAWLQETLDASQIEEFAHYGADTGWPGLTCTANPVEWYARHEAEIRQALNEGAEALGYDSPEALVATFNRSDVLWTEDGRWSLLVWYLAERTAREMVEGP